jgi:hypothetical protein
MEETTTTIAPYRYHPLSPEDYAKVKGIVEKITSHMPEEHAGFIWNIYNAIRGVNEKQPCTCGSSGRYWGEAIAAIRVFIKERS